uniref:EF-hand domain-containing protein n=1 Tax=Heterorhabditis bacteriophora TaxID=37862 RepID=A0A1I7WGI1_HETBA
MEKDSFDPRTFFALHDLNGDGFWNADELEALFQLELEKMYNETNPDDDPRERMEEMYRMREHVTKQMDKNGDRMISIDEFLQVGLVVILRNLYFCVIFCLFRCILMRNCNSLKKNTPNNKDNARRNNPQHQNVQQEHHPNHVNAVPVRPQELHASSQQIPVHHEPIVDLPKDPSYGI